MAEAHGAYEEGLSKRAFYKTNDIEKSQDLVQTNFFKTLLYLQKGGKIHLMRSFLSHILNDLIIDEYRKKSAVSLDVLLENGLELSNDDRERLINIFDGKKVIALIPQLPVKYQEVIRLRYINGLSLKEISLITGQSQNTVAVQIHRALVKLKVLYIPPQQ
jgi:RNA polymerase sigma-70 factor (ECF subfamily)